MTLKSIELLEKAEAVVYDDLAADAALGRCAEGTELLYVGKRGGKPSMRQADIDATLVRLCSEGKQVVRLKGGCSSVFSRVGSEMRALAAAGIDYELVPGVSSVTAAPALAGFPLTDTDVGRSFVVSSAHAPAALDWDAFRKIDTVVLLMGASGLSELVDLMLAHSWDASTPVAVVKSAGTDAQQVWYGELSNIVETTCGESLSPCVIVLGQVVLLWQLQLGAPWSQAAPP